jgi:ABC-type multidrug transport system fused ATPase/permease subunit
VTTGTLFTSLAYFNALQGPLAMLPIFLNFYGRFLIYLARVEDFPVAEESDAFPIPPEEPAAVPVQIEKATFQWFVFSKSGGGSNDDTSDEAVPGWGLTDISLTVPQGQLLAIVGPTGSGKSSLLSAVLRDMPLTKGSVRLDASVAVVAQEVRIFNASVRENVIFGHPFEEKRYNEALRVSALLPDVRAMDYGDQTEIGAKGVNLSGGQKQRVSIARAVYADAQVYLLDDCLSALDSGVARHVFEQCLINTMKARGKTNARTHARTHACTHERRHACVHAGMHVRRHARMQIHTQARTPTCTHAQTNARMHTRNSKHARTH